MFSRIMGDGRFKYYLYGTEFVLRSDHKALEKLNQGPLKSARIERWMERLTVYILKTQYKEGKSMGHVDALSREFEAEINHVEKGRGTNRGSYHKEACGVNA